MEILALNWKELCFRVNSIMMYVYINITYYVYFLHFGHKFQLFEIKNKKSLNLYRVYPNCLNTHSPLIKCEIQFIVSDLYYPHCRL